MSETTKQQNGAFAVASALTDSDFKLVSVGGKIYPMHSPTIYRLGGCIRALTSMRQGNTVRDVLETVGDFGCLSTALSWLIKGDDSLSGELSDATPKEVVDALESGLSLIDIKVFTTAVSLTRYVARLAASSPK